MSDSNPKSSIRGQIDENLKRIYQDALKEQIPDRLTDLLEQLRQKTSGASDGGDDRGKT